MTLIPSIQHHADVATLISFASGALPEALSAVVEVHLAVCPQCAREVRRMEAVGASLFGGLAPERLSAPTPAIDQIAGGDVELSPHANPEVDAIMRGNLDAVRWRRLGVGLWHAKVPMTVGAKGDLRLLKVAPGRKLPEHGHGGAELTCILQGAYTDEVGTFRAGDIADLDDEVEHRPVSDPTVGCICLIASEHPARFKGFIPRLVQPLTGM